MKRREILIAALLLCGSMATSCKFVWGTNNTSPSTNDNGSETGSNTGDNGNSGNSGDSGESGDSGNTQTGTTTLKIISCNDFHGVVEHNGSYPGLEAFGAKIKSIYDEDPENTLILSAGDMYQGSGVSSITKGKVVIDAMNYVKFDCMSVGNHEFDWGLDPLRNAHDGIAQDYDNDTKTVNPEANFPYLGCNIYYNNGTDSEADDTYASDFVQPYVVLERAGLKIGVIGYIGTDQLNSICKTIGGQFDFHDPVSLVGKYAEQLRSEGCQFIIANGHDGTTATNNSISLLSGNQKVDYILNGHTHNYYVNTTTGGQYAIQSGSYGTNIGYAEFTYDYSSKKATCTSTPTNTNSTVFMTMTDSTLAANSEKHLNLVSPVLNEVIGTLDSSISYNSNRSAICKWTSDCIRQQTGADFGITNYGGIRSSGFPLAAGNITVNTVMGIMPFDNVIVKVSMTGSELSSLYSRLSSYCGFSFNFSTSSLVSSQTYTVVFDEYSYGKYSGHTDGQFTEYLVRDAMINEIRNQTKSGKSWTYTSAATFVVE